jgi:tetratricopeptide (TPR) repeat protein
MSSFANPAPAVEQSLAPRTHNPVLEWSLRPAWRAALFLIPLVAVSVWLSLEIVRVAQVTFQVNTVSTTDIAKAIKRDPKNSDLYHRLGWVYASNPADINLEEAVKNLQQAVALNPRRWDYWSDLGVVCDFAQNTACSDEAFKRAVALNPMSPNMQWSVANHYLLTGREEQAFANFRKLLEMDESYLGATFQLCLRATGNPQAIYTKVVPHGKDASARFAFLMYLASAADYESAMRIWAQMIAGPDHAPDLTMVKPYLDFLLDHNELADAQVVWKDLQHAGVVPAAPASEAANAIYDGGFEFAPVNTGFDWRTSDSPDVIFDFADPDAHQGSKCLRINFPVGRNAEYDLLNQVVLTKPNTRYQLTAYVRSDNLTSSSGPRLRVSELGCPNCQALTGEGTVGTTPWHAVELVFTTQPQTQAVKVSFWRPRDTGYSGDITGSVWLDDINLHAVTGSQPEVSQVRVP